MIWNDRIKQLRLADGLTLKDVAARLGLTEATAQRYESGAIKSIPYEILVGYSNLFSCSPAYLMGWESQNDINLSEFERTLVIAYRQAPESRRESVRALLNIQKKGDIEQDTEVSVS